MHRTKYLLLSTFIAAAGVWQSVASPTVINVEKSTKFNDSQWQNGFSLLQNKGRPAASSRFSVSCDGVNLRIRFEAVEPAMDKLKVISAPLPDPPVWRGDAVEISIANEPGLVKFYKFCLAPDGSCFDALMEDNNTGTQTYVLRDDFAAGVKAVPRKTADGWGLDVTIPLADLAVPDKAEWRLNVARMRAAGTSEISTFCPMPAKLDAPIRFARLKMPFFDNRMFRVNAKTGEWEINRTREGRFVAGFQRSLLNLTGRFAVLESRLQLRDARTGKVIGESRSRLGLDHGESERFSQEIEFEKSGAAILESEIRNGKGDLLKRESTKIDLHWRPITTEIVRPAYRNNIYATMPDKKIEVKVASDKPVSFTAAFYNRSNQIVAKAQQFTTPATVTLDTAKLADGEYFLKLTGKYAGSDFKQELRFRKLPFSTGEIWFDRQKIMYIEGKPFFPVMVYGAEGKRSKGINSWQRMDHFRDFEHAKAFFKGNLAQGRYTLNTPWQEFNPEYNHLRWKVFKTPRILDEPTPEQVKIMTRYVDTMKHTPGILGWYLSDEPEGPGDNPLWYESSYKILAETDPYHPTVICNWSPAWAAKFHKGCDVLFPDCYIHYYEDNSTDRPRSRTAEFVKEVSHLRPTWLFVQLSGHPLRSKDGKLRGRVPTMDELRLQVYQAIANNAKGISFYKHTYASMYEIGGEFGVDALAEELQKLMLEILPDTVVDGVKARAVPAEPTLCVGMKPNLLIASNPSNKKLRVTYTFPQAVALYEAGTCRSFSGRSFSDELLPFETRLYCKDKALAVSLTPVAEQRRRLQKAIDDRKVPGNLIGQGEIYESDQRDWSNGKLKPGVPILSASSDKRIWETRDYGSLYFCIDGQRYTNSHFTSWMPQSSDKAPWFEVKLNKAAKLGRVELFTQGTAKGAILASGRLLVRKNKKWHQVAEFKDNKKLRITATFPQVVTDGLRLEVTRIATLPDADSLCNRLLTEIEWYEK